MIKLVAEINNRRTLILGLSRMNSVNLHNGRPIIIDVQALIESIQATEGSRPPQDIVLCAGDTEEDIYAELRDHMPQLPPIEEITR